MIFFARSAALLRSKNKSGEIFLNGSSNASFDVKTKRPDAAASKTFLSRLPVMLNLTLKINNLIETRIFHKPNERIEILLMLNKTDFAIDLHIEVLNIFFVYQNLNSLDKCFVILHWTDPADREKTKFFAAG